MKQVLFYTLFYTVQKPEDYYLTAACGKDYQVRVKSNAKAFPENRFRLYFVYREYLIQSIHAVANRGKYDTYVFIEPQIGVMVACLARLFRLQMPKIILINFIPAQQKKLSRLLESFYRFSLSGVDALSVSSRGLIDIYANRYGIPLLQFFIPDSTHFHRAETFTEEDFIFSGGYSHRDWPILLDAALSLPMYKFVVCASGRDSMFFSKPIPVNVSVKYDVSTSDFYNTLSQAGIVVVPLKYPEVGAGQLVIIHSLYYGKAVIATRTVGTVEYIEDGVNGLLCNLGDAPDLAKKIRVLMDSTVTRERLKANALQSSKLYTHERYIQNVLAMIKAVTAEDTLTEITNQPNSI